MIKLNFQWKKKTMIYQNGESLYLGKVIVGNYEYNSTRSKAEPRDKSKDYKGHSILLQMDRNVYSSTTEEIKKKIERQVTIWFNEVLGEK